MLAPPPKSNNPPWMKRLGKSREDMAANAPKLAVLNYIVNVSLMVDSAQALVSALVAIIRLAMRLKSFRLRC